MLLCQARESQRPGFEPGPCIAWRQWRVVLVLVHQVLLTSLPAVQWHYIEMLSNDTVPNHTLITTNHQALFIYNRTKIADDFW